MSAAQILTLLAVIFLALGGLFAIAGLDLFGIALMVVGVILVVAMVIVRVSSRGPRA
ncbi:hypothetical protein [Dietzia sp. 179-F 9C3 NHS]|uniref:hypothetical protein n=1 Tax=Dietzia sp. 179-F 9C3 NHS TaxID=3374295 RepID=UPI003879C1E9